MSDEEAPGPQDDAPAVEPRRTRASSAEGGDAQPVGRALLSRSAESRDWADTGDPDYEPALEGESAGHGHDGVVDRGADGEGSAGFEGSGPEDETSLERRGDAGVTSREQDTTTVVLSRGAFAQAVPEAARAAQGDPVPEATGGRRDRTAAVDRDEWASEGGPARDRLTEVTEVAAETLTGPDAPATDAPTTALPASAAVLPASATVLPNPATVPPDPDGPAEVDPATRRPRRAAPRQPMLLQGLLPALVATALLGSSTLGVLPLAVVVLAVQVFLILGALALLDAPAAGGAFLVAAGTVVVADVVVLLDEGSVSGLAAVAGLGFVAALGHQLARRGRSRVTESLADTLVVLVVGVSAACLLALHEVAGGREVLQVSLAAAGAVLLAGRVGDRFAPHPVLAVGSTRGWPGLVMGLLAGVVAAGVIAQLADQPPLRSALLLGLVVASTVATADLAVDLGAAELRSGWRDARRVAALRPTALLLPFAVLGPVALLAGRLLLT